jgi:putative oxidoreductase
MNTLIQYCSRVGCSYRGYQRVMVQLSPLFDCVLRLYLFRVFFQSGWVKLNHWPGTLYLFQYEYHVPLLPAPWAAVLATAVELGLSGLLLVGGGTRFAATGLLVLNAVALLSYPGLTPETVKDHYLWGALLAVMLFHGAGGWSLDAWCKRIAK